MTVISAVQKVAYKDGRIISEILLRWPCDLSGF